MGQQSNRPVESIDTLNTGKIEVMIGTVTFSSGEAAISGSGGKGDLVVIENNGVFQGNQLGIAPETESETVPYSNTATTFTLNGETFDATYANVVSNVANYLDFLLVDTTSDCVEHGTAVHQ